MNIDRNGICIKIKNEKELIKNNLNDIEQYNRKSLNIYLNLSLFIIITLFSLSLFIKSFYSLKNLYLIEMTFIIVLKIIFNKFKNIKTLLLCNYAFFFVVVVFTVYLSIFVSPQSMAASIIGVLCIIPLVFFDRTWRINTMLMLFFTIHTVLAFKYKNFNTAVSDSINVGCFTLVSMFAGIHARKNKLYNFEMNRRATLQQYIDFLTGIYNRRKMFEILEGINPKNENKKVTGFMMFDIDKFKLFNDTCGHQAGDECLRELGIFLLRFGKENDLMFFRYGGEEFAALSYDKSYDEISELAERIRKEIISLRIPFPATELKYITISGGFCVADNTDYDSYKKYISKADELLYFSKANGRNKVTGCKDVKF